MSDPNGSVLPLPASALEAAREELREATTRGLGGRGALGRYAARVDALLRQLFEAAPPPVEETPEAPTNEGTEGTEA